MFYVTMTDKFLSGWGHSEGRTNKLIFPCTTYAEALIVERNALDRDDMIYVNIRTTKPYYNKRSYYPQTKTRKDYPTWYKARRPFHSVA